MWPFPHVVTWSQNLWAQNFEVPMFRVRGSHLPSHISTRLQDHFTTETFRRRLIFILQDLRTTKCDWVETHSETWFDHIMLSTPHIWCLRLLLQKEESFQIKLKFKSKLIVSCFAEKVVAIFWILRNILNMKTATKYETLFYERALKM